MYYNLQRVYRGLKNNVLVLSLFLMAFVHMSCDFFETDDESVDLVISVLEMTHTGGAQIQAGDTIRVDIGEMNLGDDHTIIAHQMRIGVTIASDEENSEMADVRFDVHGLESRATKMDSFSVVFNQPGQYTILGVADSGGVVNEKDDDNNATRLRSGVAGGKQPSDKIVIEGEFKEDLPRDEYVTIIRYE